MRGKSLLLETYNYIKIQNSILNTNILIFNKCVDKTKLNRGLIANFANKEFINSLIRKYLQYNTVQIAKKQAYI